MTGELHAREQVDRLSGLACFTPRDERENARAELVQVLRGAENAQVAAIAINRWLEEATEWPTPAELKRLVLEENTALSRQRGSGETCRVCDGAGFVVIRVGMYTGAKPCECLPQSHHGRAGNDPHEHEYWKPHWKHPRTEAW